MDFTFANDAGRSCSEERVGSSGNKTREIWIRGVLTAARRRDAPSFGLSCEREGDTVVPVGAATLADPRGGKNGRSEPFCAVLLPSIMVLSFRLLSQDPDSVLIYRVTFVILGPDFAENNRLNHRKIC